jgi:transposase
LIWGSSCFPNRKVSGDTSNLFWLTNVQVSRLKPSFPTSHGKPRVDDRRVLSGTILINRNGLRLCDALEEYGPHKTLCGRWKRWGENGACSPGCARLALAVIFWRRPSTGPEPGGRGVDLTSAKRLKNNRSPAFELLVWWGFVAQRPGEGFTL